jgi:hypothetical protein
VATALVSGLDWSRRDETRTLGVVAISVAGIEAAAVTARTIAPGPTLVDRSGDVISGEACRSGLCVRWRDGSAGGLGEIENVK